MNLLIKYFVFISCTAASYTFLDVQDVVSRAMHAQLSAELSSLREEREQMVHSIGNSSNGVQLSNAAELKPPTIPKKGPLKVLDIGSGEIGFNSFDTTADVVKMNNTKVTCNFLKEYLEPQEVKKFVDAILEHFPQSENEKIYIGLTGANREFYAKNPEPMQKYFLEMEKYVKLEWFVPSGEQEAQYELSAVKYLSLQTGVGKIDGVISGGGGSCQMSTSRGILPKVYSIPLGNKSPEKFPLFGEKVQDKLSHWYSLLGREIGFDIGRDFEPFSGKYVGISAMFYGAKSAGITGRFLTKTQALEKIDKRLNVCLDEGNERDVWNLAMMRSVLLLILADDAEIFFQRNWKVGNEELVATWSLGMYVE